MQSPTRAPDIGLYVHVPFCERICPYCDFAVEKAAPLGAKLENGYLDHLEVELERVLAGPASEAAGRRLRTIHLGGGTPSLLAPSSVSRLLSGARAHFSGIPDEITLELNPVTTECSRLPEFLEAGVTRVSVGVQSLSDDTLRRLGRGHRAEEALRGLSACLGAGFDSVSADLIFGAPGQSESGFLDDLERLIELGVPHISAYALTLEPGTPFARAAQRGELPLPDEAATLAMSRRLRARLEAAGPAQYEISSFARPGHASRHNQRYWLRRDVLGIGVGASSLLGSVRWKNHRSRRAWEESLEKGATPVEEREVLAEAEIRRETLFLGFRRNAGVSRAGYFRRFGEAPEHHFAAELRELRQLELIEDRAGSIVLSERGIRFADEVFLRFVAC